MGATSEAWSEFLAAPVTLGPAPGARERWRRGRARYSVWLLRIHAPEALARLGWVQRALSGRIEPVDPADAHVTAYVAGFPADTSSWDDDVPRAALEAATADLLAAPPRAPALTLGRASAFLSCAMIEIEDPAGELAAIRARIAPYHRELRFAPFRPHLTAGAFLRSEPTGPIAALLAQARGWSSIPLRPTSLERVEFDAARSGAPLETMDRILLSAPR